MAQVLQMPAMGLDVAEQEQARRQEFDNRRLQGRLQTRAQTASQQATQLSGIKNIKKETDSVIRLVRLITALSLIGTILYLAETVARYLTANLLGFEWPGVWQKVGKVESWLMFGGVGIVLIAFVIFLSLMVLLNPVVLAQFGLDLAWGWIKNIGCQFFTCK